MQRSRSASEVHALAQWTDSDGNRYRLLFGGTLQAQVDGSWRWAREFGRLGQDWWLGYRTTVARVEIDNAEAAP